MMKIVTLDKIKKVLPSLDLMPAIEAGFVAYSAGRSVVPPVGELLLEKGEVHIKYGFIKEDEHYVIKIASGFYGNPQLGLPTSSGLMLMFRQATGQPVAALLDEGVLTDVRTAVAGAIAAKYLAPQQVQRIGIVGTGVQARLQLQHLQAVTECREVLVWGRGEAQLARYQAEMTAAGFQVETTQNASDILASCNLIVTTTPASEPILQVDDLREGVHITAVGSDTPHKQELDGAILGKADLVVADSIPQCLVRGEIYKATEGGHLQANGLVELGDVIAGNVNGRVDDSQITIADLTGVAVQDIQIANAIFSAL